MKKLSIIAAIAGAFLVGGCACRTLTLVSVDGKPCDGIAALIAEAPMDAYSVVPDASIYEMFQPDTRTEFDIALAETDLSPNFFRELLCVLTLGVIPIREDRIEQYRFVYAPKDGPLDVARVQVRYSSRYGLLPTAWLPPTLPFDDYSLSFGIDYAYPDHWRRAEKAYLSRLGEFVWRIRNGGAR